MQLSTPTISKAIFLTVAVLSCAITSPARPSGARQPPAAQTTSPDFTISASSPSFTVMGGEADGTITFAGQDDFSGSVLVSCSVLPDIAEGPQCFIFPDPVTVDSSGSPSTVMLNVFTQLPDCEPTPVSSKIMTFPGDGSGLARLGINFLLLVMLACWAKLAPAGRGSKAWRTAVICAVGLAISGCGAPTANHSVCDTGNFDAGTPPGTYMMTISGTSGNLAHTATVSVIVPPSQ